MNGSTFCEIKYIKGYFLYMIRIGVGLKILGSHTHTKNNPQVTPLCPHPLPQKRFINYSKMFPKSKVFNYQKNQWLFI